MIKWYAYKKHFNKNNNYIFANKDTYLKINKNYSKNLKNNEKIKVFKGAKFKLVGDSDFYYLIDLLNKEEKKIYISIGWRCDSAVRRSTVHNMKKPEYYTCPFDLMISNLNGIINCFENNFENFCNPKYLTYNGKGYIKNTFYNFMFNHETPGHANLHLTENWPGNNKYHFTENNFKNFIERYNKRISNLKNYIEENDHIIFILQMVSINENNQLILKFKNILKKKYQEKKFSFDLFHENDKNLFNNHMLISGLKKKDIDLLT
jgi:hypothetical protein